MYSFLLRKYLHITAVVALYWTVSISTVFINKALLSNNGINLETPFFIIWYQCFMSVIICCILKKFAKLYPDKLNFPDGSPFSREAIFNVLPISFMFTCMIIFNGLCLKYVGVSFYYIVRSLTTVFNVLLTWLVLKTKVSSITCTCCLVIVVGFLLGIDQENILGTFSLGGTLSGLLASFSLALYSVYTKKVLPYVKNSIWMLSYYNNVYSCIMMLPIMFGADEFRKIITHPNILSDHFWILMSIGGICGFSMGYVTSLQIKVTSPLTHNISGTAKACVQTIIATVWYEEKKTILWWISNYVILLGSFAYARVKQLEMQEKMTPQAEKSFETDKPPVKEDV